MANSLSLKEFWSYCLEQMRSVMTQDLFLTLNTFEVREQGKNQALLLAPNKYAFDLIQQNYWGLIEETCRSIGEKNRCSWRFKLGFEAQRDVFKQQEALPKTEPVFSTHLNPIYQFHNFISGPSNDHAFAAAVSVAQEFTPHMNPLMIYGGSGLGKSHLLHAIGNQMKANGLKKVLYTSGDEFVNHFVNAIRESAKGKFKEFTDYLRSLDALILDDVQFIANKERSQMEFFNIYNHLFDNKKQIVLASDRTPREIEGLEERLKSRFGSGVTVSVQIPDFETRLAIVLKKSEMLNFELPQDVAHQIANSVKTNIRELEGALRTLYMRYNHDKRMPTANIVRSLVNLSEPSPSPEPPIKKIEVKAIQQAVADFYAVTVAELLMKKRGKAHIVLARQVAMCLAKELTNLSYNQLGSAFQREHSTIIHAQNAIQEKLKQDFDFQRDYQELRQKLRK